MQPTLERALPAATSRPLKPEPLHVAIVDEELPYPLTTGKRIRTYNLVRRLADRHHLTFLCHRNPNRAEARHAEAHFAEIGVRAVVVDRSVPPKSGPLFYARLAANLLSALPYSVSSHDSSALRRALRRHAEKQRVDLWHCEWTPYAQVLRGLPGPRVVMAHNVESVIWQRYFKTERNPLKRWYIGRQWAKFRNFEQRVLSGADQVMAVSDLDADRIRADCAEAAVTVIENGVDTDFFKPLQGPRDPHRVLFLGSLDWRPNLDGVGLLLREVFPAVRAAVRTASLALVGRAPPGWLHQEVARCPGVRLHGDVPDVRPHLARAGLMVVPLRIGGGSRLKILEALASGVPVVSTKVGAEGLALEPGTHFMQADRIGDLASTLIEALRDPARLRREVAAGRQLVLKRYDWSRMAQELEQVWLACASSKSQRQPA